MVEVNYTYKLGYTHTLPQVNNSMFPLVCNAVMMHMISEYRECYSFILYNNLCAIYVCTIILCSKDDQVHNLCIFIKMTTILTMHAVIFREVNHNITLIFSALVQRECIKTTSSYKQ